LATTAEDACAERDCCSATPRQATPRSISPLDPDPPAAVTSKFVPRSARGAAIKQPRPVRLLAVQLLLLRVARGRRMPRPDVSRSSLLIEGALSENQPCTCTCTRYCTLLSHRQTLDVWVLWRLCRRPRLRGARSVLVVHGDLRPFGARARLSPRRERERRLAPSPLWLAMPAARGERAAIALDLPAPTAALMLSTVGTKKLLHKHHPSKFCPIMTTIVHDVYAPYLKPPRSFFASSPSSASSKDEYSQLRLTTLGLSLSLHQSTSAWITSQV